MRKFALHARPASTRSALVAVAAAGLLAAAPAAAGAAGWVDGPKFNVAAPAAGVDFSAAPDGSSTAAWSGIDIRDTSAPGLVGIQHAAANGTLGQTQTLGTAAPDTLQTDVASGASGASAVVWAGVATNSDPVKLALLRPDGSVVGTYTVADDLRAGVPTVAVDGGGNALVAWIGYDADADEQVAKLRRVTATGALGRTLTLGPAAISSFALSLSLAVIPSGTGWVTWNDGTVDSLARITPSGELDASDALPSPGASAFAALASNDGGAVLTRLEIGSGGPSSARVAGLRLPTSGALFGAGFQSAELTSVGGTLPPTGKPALAADGTVTFAWTGGELTDPTTAHLNVSYTRFPPGATFASVQQLPASGSAMGEMLPFVSPVAGGGTLLSWLRVDNIITPIVDTTMIAADGTLGPVLSTGLSASFVSGGVTPTFDHVLMPYGTNEGALLGVSNQLIPGLGSLTVKRLDVVAPQLSATIPAGGVTGQPLTFSAAVSDGSVWWDFGDDSGSRRAVVNHTYGTPGTYAISVTATDAAGNATTRSGQLTIAAPATPPTPGARRTAAGLKLTSAVRSGGDVTIAGTIASTASGRVGLVYAQKNGRRTLSASTSARIAKGRFSVKLKLSKALAKTFRLKPTVTASYAGSATLDAARTVRTVTLRRAARRSARRSGKKKR
ncbi:PKD domain-containing protein [Conexibacter sp. JD483]|uniref:PKD domain-containing protein n=1 Tax=unclassified Conexibacter TaxID=2627773 RepID=UPI00271BF9AF|nr:MULTISPECIES: PKD domain-containing protein [unclassified Conexibacter]MDO8186923.1 PKD domain-containing protein [Conexibacter sp. CPCC 205706]MDO8200622.1 PKD domain-containing protein [Conexibacter sp. CPCC 205762]MDR9368800.1 PKD domain-containing protein [Conexibacter sp. JD483]